MKRIFWEKEEKLELEKSFSQNPHPDMATKQLLADKFRVTVEKITNFFKNKRQKMRRSGHPIKRVFREEKSKQAMKKSEEVLKTPAAAIPNSVPPTEYEQEIVIVKIETIEPDSNNFDAPKPHQNEMSSNPILDKAPAPLQEIRKNNPDQHIRKIPKMGITAKITKSNIQGGCTETPCGPIQSLFKTTPLLTRQQASLKPFTPLYPAIQTPYIPSCLDFTAGQYFPINHNQTPVSFNQPVANRENLDDILHNNLKKLDESEDTGIETDSFECLSEQDKEIEIKPLPNWFPFSALYPNQPIYPKTNPFLTF